MRILDHNLGRVGRWSAAANVVLSKDPEFIRAALNQVADVELVG